MIMAFPDRSRLTEMFCVRTVGAVLSITVTIAVPVEIFPLSSLTVKVTILEPILEQSKLVWSSVRVSMPQLSLEPLLI